jgi:hypothetical protein
MIEFRIEQFTDEFIEELKPLTVQHYDEIALHKQHIPLDPDWNLYKKMTSNNSLFVAGARDNGQLVGYSIFFISRMAHYQSTLCANNDVLYLLPKYRQGIAGIKLIKFCETELKKMNIVKLLWHIKFAKDFRKILYRMGYCDEDAIVGKILKE